MLAATYEFTIKEMLLHHDHVDNLGVFESQETETTRASSDSIAHHCAFCDFAELGEVVLERFYE